jgi:biotin carboxyl carrier protein
MPGSIMDVSVKPGDAVEEGEELLVLEAMKMENPIVATVDGTVKEVTVKKDDKVATNQLMVVIE